MGTNGFKVKTENNFFIVICSRCRRNLKIDDFTLLFCGVRQRNARKFVLHVQHEHFNFLFQPIIFLLCGVAVAVRVVFAKTRDFTIYDAVVNENASKQQYHWLKEEK